MKRFILLFIEIYKQRNCDNCTYFYIKKYWDLNNLGKPAVAWEIPRCSRYNEGLYRHNLFTDKCYRKGLWNTLILTIQEYEK